MSYVDSKKLGLEFQIGDPIFLKMSHIKEVIKLGIQNKISPNILIQLKFWKRLEM